MSTQAASTDYEKTALLAAMSGGILLSFDVPLLRLAASDSNSIIIIRGLFMFVALFVFWRIFLYRGGKGINFINGPVGLLSSCLMALANILFVNAIFYTSVANVVFILAFNPLFAAIMGRVFLKEHVPWQTALAIASALTGVFIILWQDFSSPNMIGNLMALGVSFTLSIQLTVVRHSKTNQAMSPALGSLLSAICIFTFVGTDAIKVEHISWLALNGLLIMPLASALLLWTPRYISGSVVALFFLLETVLTPIWMWVFLDESPSYFSILGGTLIIITLSIHSLWQINRSIRSRS